MKSFLQELTNRLAAANPNTFTRPPSASANKEDKELGTANDQVRQLFVVWQDLEVEHDALVEQLSSGVDDKDVEQQHNDIDVLLDIVKKMLLSEVNNQFPESRDGGYIAFAKDWQIVLGKKQEPERRVKISIIGLGGSGSPSLFDFLNDDSMGEGSIFDSSFFRRRHW